MYVVKMVNFVMCVFYPSLKKLNVFLAVFLCAGC